MKKALSLAFLLALGTLANAQSAVQRLDEVKTIYVAPLDSQDRVMASMVTERLVSYLAKRRSSVSIVNSEDNADAIFKASFMAHPVQNEFGHTRYVVHGTAHLDSKDGVVLWADDASNSPFAKSATSSFADNIAKS